MKNSTTLSSVENALRVLNSFSTHNPEKGITQLSNELNLAKSTISRLIKTLHLYGYVKKDEQTRKYSLGTKILSLYGSFMSKLEIVKEAHPFLVALAKETSEAVQLAELEGSNVIYLEQIKSAFPIEIFAHIGRINPIHCTSSGKLLLAYQEDSVIDDILNVKLEKFTSSTIIDFETLKKELQGIKKLGYSYIENEFIDGIVSIAAPIRDHNKNVIAAVSLVGPVQRIDGVKRKIYISRVVEAGKKISKYMGYEE